MIQATNTTTNPTTKRAAIGIVFTLVLWLLLYFALQSWVVLAVSSWLRIGVIATCGVLIPLLDSKKRKNVTKMPLKKYLLFLLAICLFMLLFELGVTKLYEASINRT
jgi:hypothetical protein